MTVESGENPPATWIVLANSGEVRDKFLQWTPVDVKQVSSLEMLEALYAYYTPSFHPDGNLSEYGYCEEMLQAILIQYHFIP